MDLMTILQSIDSIVWGPPLIILLLGTGIFLSLRLGMIQVVKLPMALKLIFKAQNKGQGDVSSFRSLCVALAATVGTGNIVGVATAIKLGGPGALFWMWLAAFFGMATKYAEGLLAIKYRTIDTNGEVAGGPMYYIERGLGQKWKPLAVFFAMAGVLVALLGIGTFPQVNAVIESVNVAFGVPVYYTAAVVTVLVALITIGGLQSIAKASSAIIPFMAFVYVAICLIVLIINVEQIPAAIALVLESAFTGHAAAGGFAGSTIMMAMQAGMARGMFSNESGLGSAPIVAAAAKTKWPAEQGLISMTGTFIDTLIICMMTGLTIILTGVWTGPLAGAAMTSSVYALYFGDLGTQVLTFCLVLFAFTTTLGWNYYGERCCYYLFGAKAIKLYRLIFIVMVASTVFLKLDEIWVLADIVNGLMAIPNLIALLGLSGVIVYETKKYFKHLEEKGK